MSDNKPKRKGISKRRRFEIFKRDKFTCQYCGKTAPDVILEVDHIIPVAAGGKNTYENLITSCRDCNRGKGKTRLSDDTEIKKQQAQLLELAERREQIQMMGEWRLELQKMMNEQVDYCEDLIDAITGYRLNDYGRNSIAKLITRFSFDEVLTAIDTSFSFYFEGDDKSWANAFNKIGGICYNRRKQNGTL